MTAKEKKVYEKWNKKMTAQGDARDTYFEEMRALYEKHSGGKAPFSLEVCFEYLMTSNDKYVRNSAIVVLEKYHQAVGQYAAFLELGQALADVR